MSAYAIKYGHLVILEMSSLEICKYVMNVRRALLLYLPISCNLLNEMLSLNLKKVQEPLFYFGRLLGLLLFVL